MVFGWTKKKTEKQDTLESKKEKSIKMSEIKDILDDVSSIRVKSTIVEVVLFKKKIENNISEILKIANELKHDNLKVDELDKRLQVIVVRGKEEVISTIQNEGKTTFPEIKSYDGVLAFNDKALQTLKKIGDILGKNSKLIHIFAKKYANKLKDTLAILTSDQAAVQNLVNTHKKIQDDISDVLSKIVQIKELEKTLAEKKTRSIELNDNIEAYDGKINAGKLEINKVKASSDYGNFLKIKQMINNLENEESQIKNEINTQFMKISKPLSRYVYITSFDKPQKQLLEKLVEEPYGVLNSTNKENIIQILYAVKKGVQAGSVSVKDNEKTISNIDETILLIDNYILQILEFSRKKNDSEKKAATFSNEKLDRLDKELSKNMFDKQDAESKIQNLEKETLEINQKIINTIHDIETTLQAISGTKYHLIMN